MQAGRKQKVMVDPETAQPMNRLARERMKLHLLQDIRIDMAICEIEGWDKTEYIRELQEVINEFRTGDREGN